MVAISKAKWLARRTAMVAAAAALLAQAPSLAHAAPLDLTLQGSPDMMCDFIDVRYDAATHMLSATGYAEELGGGASQATAIVNGTFELNAMVTSSGEMKGGTLVIKGEVPSAGIEQGALLTGSLTEIGFGEKDGPLEFKFDTTGGSLGYNFGSQIRVIMSQSGFGGDFGHDFTSNSIAVAGIGW